LILAPTSSIIPIKDLAFEHRMYLPLAGVLAILIVAGVRLAELGRDSSLRMAGMPTTMSRMVLPILAAGCMVLTVSRNRLYADPVAFLQQTAERAPTNARPLNALGHALLMDGQYAEALSALQRASGLDPASPSPHANMGMTLATMGESARAAEQFDRAWAIRRSGYHWNVHYFYGVALLDTNRPVEAVEQFRIVLGQNPGHVAALYNLGNALRLSRQLETAVGVYQDALRAQPNYAEACVNLGLTLLEIGREDEAVATFRRSLRIGGASDDARFKGNYHLGRALLHRGRDGEAARHFRAALKIIPDHAGATESLRLCAVAASES
jgi:tetratricopeptide (TPR) repeat protein